MINQLPLITIKVNRQNVQRRRVRYRPDGKRVKMRLTAADDHERDPNLNKQGIVAVSPKVRVLSCGVLVRACNHLPII